MLLELRSTIGLATRPQGDVMDSKSLPVGAAEDVLVCVDSLDNILGYKGKAECHTGDGILHRAFSVFLFNSRDEVLLQRRARGKRLWPEYWSNACCSHPRKDELLEHAVQRRLMEELGVQTPARLLFTFEYHARYLTEGSEHELCAVLAGRFDGDVLKNEDEVAEWQFVDPEELDTRLVTHPELYTPWLKLEWARIRAGYRDVVAAL
jgi:isopentenyl-diphosphate Delta-isomerase